MNKFLLSFVFLGLIVAVICDEPTVDNKPRCPAKDGKYPVYIPSRDCTKFYECSNGIPYLFDCPPGLHFNPRKNVCDWPADAGCRNH